MIKSMNLSRGFGVQLVVSKYNYDVYDAAFSIVTKLWIKFSAV